jgi:UDP:flavonoid glycosyltransferase YjiC (YdhE family)
MSPQRSATSSADHEVIVTSFLARPLAFLLAKLHPHIKVYILNLQPTCPNKLFPNYRVSTLSFVHAIVTHEDRYVTKDVPGTAACAESADREVFIETYWKLEHALESIFLADEMNTLYKEKSKEPQHDSAWSYYSWKELQQILSGQNDQFVLVNAYSNHLVPSLEKKPTPRVYEVGPLADGYIPPGSPPQALLDFLNKHPKYRRPICVGFGSMVFPNPQIIVEALHELNRPAVLVGSCMRLDGIQGNILQEFAAIDMYFTANVPYPWLLPHCSMMICHGGAGVVHACLRAGTPCVVVPVMGDQHAWGALLEARGFGVLVERRLSELTKQDVIRAILDVHNDKNLWKKCDNLGEVIRRQQQTGSEKLAGLINMRR